MPENKTHYLIYGRIFFGLFVFFGIYLTWAYLGPLYQSLVIGLELILAGGIFTVGWNTRRRFDHGFFLILGTGWLFIGLLKFLAWPAPGKADLLAGSTPLLPENFTGAALYLESICLLGAPFFLGRRVRAYLVFLIFTLISLSILTSIYLWPVFSLRPVQAPGHLFFHRISALVILAAFAASLVGLKIRGQLLNLDIRRLLLAGVALDMLTTAFIFFYAGSPSPVHPLIDFLRFFSWYLIYRAVTGAGLIPLHDDYPGGLAREQNDMGTSFALTRDLYNQIPTMLHSVNGRGQLIDVSDYWLVNMGYQRNEVIGRSLLDFFTPPSRRYAQEVVWPQFVQHGVINDIPYQMVKKNREVIDVLISATAQKDDRGNLIRTLGVVTDITNSKQAESQIKEARSSALAASLAKGLFLGKLSYEIRTPMNSIIGMTSLALDTELDKEQREYLEAVNTSALHLLGVFNDIFDLSKIEAGALELENANFELRQNLTAIIKIQSAKAREKGLELTCRIDPEVPDELVGDAGRLKQVVYNLLQNAITFTDEGEISMAVNTLRNEENHVSLHFRVSDTGRGLSKERRGVIFDPFFQNDALSGARHGDTGLGLAIVKQLVRLMGGDIRIESGPDGGNSLEFTVRLKKGQNSRTISPSARTDPGQPPEPEDGPGKKLRILLAEDNPVNSKLAERILEKKGHDVVPVKNGLEALEALEENNFDLLLLDIQMPKMDGLEAAAAVREKEKQTGNHLPIVAMTAHAMKGDKELCYQAGMDDFVAKPINAQKLFQVIYRVIKKNERLHANSDPSTDRTDIFDFHSALDRWGDDLSLLLKLIGIFLADLPVRIAEIQEAIRLDNAPMVKRAAHSLKGASSSLSAIRLTRALLIMENCAKIGDLTGAPELFQNVEIEIEQLKVALKDFVKARESSLD